MKIKNKRVDFIANKNFFKLLFGNNHPYGKHIKYSDILLTSRKNLITFQKKYFDFSNSLWGLAGNYNDEIIRFITEHYDILPHLNIKDLKLSTGMPSQKQLHINKKDSLQTAIKIGCQIKSLKEKIIHIFDRSNYFGGYFGNLIKISEKIKDSPMAFIVELIISSIKLHGVYLLK